MVAYPRGAHVDSPQAFLCLGGAVIAVVDGRVLKRYRGGIDDVDEFRAVAA